MSFALLCDVAWDLDPISCAGTVTTVSTNEFSTLDPTLVTAYITAGLTIGFIVWGAAWGIRAVITMIK